MILEMPNVDSERMPELARYIGEFAARYEYRLDGASMWEGRVRAMDLPEEVVQEMLNRGAVSDPMRRYLSRQLADPIFRVPAGFARVADGDDAGSIQYYINEEQRAIIARHDPYVFIVQHPLETSFRREVLRILTASEKSLKPAEVLTGRDFRQGAEERLQRW